MRKSYLGFLAFLIAAACTYYYYNLYSSLGEYKRGPYPMTWSISLPENDSAFGGLFYNPHINDSLPHYEYQPIADSIEQIKNEIKQNNKGWGNGRSYGVIGMREIQNDFRTYRSHQLFNDSVGKVLLDSLDLLTNMLAETNQQDSINNIKNLVGDLSWRLNVRSNQITENENKRAPRSYFLALKNYKLRDQYTKFFMDGKTYNLAYVVWDGIKKRSFDSTKYGHYERKRIPVRYADEDETVLVPISESKLKTLDRCLDILLYGSIFFTVYFFVGLPLLVMLSIARGKAFTMQNVRRFRWMAIAMFSYFLITVLFPYLLHFFFRNIIPDEFVQHSFFSTLLTNLNSLLIAIGLFAIALAFQRGYRLQQENALTV